jgi:hypothetical protein
VKADAIFFEGCPRQHLDAWKVSLILQSSLRSSPLRPLGALARPKEVELFGVRVSTGPYGDVLRKDDFDGAIGGRLTGQDDPERRIRVFLHHPELHADSIANASEGRLRSCLATS